jgi:hypothetical protein
MVGFRAHTAYAICEDWDFFDLTPNTKALKAAQFRDLKVGVGEISLIIEEYFDLSMAFQPGYGIYRYSLHIFLLRFNLSTRIC